MALALTALAALTFLGSQLTGLESRVYDLFQRYQYIAQNAEVVLVTAPPDAETWTAEGFARLTNRLTALGANLIVLAHPLNLPAVPPQEQIMALAELERQASRNAGASEDLQRLSAQLAGFRRAYDDQQTLVAALAASNNVVLPLEAVSGGDYRPLPAACKATAVNNQSADSGNTSVAPALLQLRSPPAGLCGAARAQGIANFWPDDDGTVRRAGLLFATAGNTILPSLALAGRAATVNPPMPLVIADDLSLVLGNIRLPTDSNYSIYMRYYPASPGAPAFDEFTVTAVLADSFAADRIAGRTVVVGATGSGAPVHHTPVHPALSAGELTATALANLETGDYLLRADWLPYLEAALLLAVLLLVLLWIPTMPAIGTLLIGFVIAMMIFSIQAWFFVSEQIWLRLSAVSLYAAVAVWGAHALHRHAPQVAAAVPAAPRPSNAVNTGRFDPLDMEFSVLRQQPATDDTKERMYQIAFQHGRAEEFAKAERVLRYIASHDPDYKDVRSLLQKLSGRRQAKPARPAPASKPLPEATVPPKPRQAQPSQPKSMAYDDSANDISTERRTLGRYRIERKLGQGAMATVYLGTDPAISRKVAIKTVALAEEFDDAQLQDAKLQFRREAESAGRLNHPNIISIYDAGEDGDVSYLAMEYFDGVSLLKHAQPDDLLPATWVMELMALAADALDYAHRQNVVHRDVKPANLMYHAASDSLKVTDFGIARLTDSSRTKTGIILGTPSYMSPEQLTASGVTGQSDLYSLGVTMYQLLTGTAPFRADSIPKLMDKIVREKHRPVSELRSDIPPCVDSILAKALAKDPADRFATGRAMAMALRECAKRFGSPK